MSKVIVEIVKSVVASSSLDHRSCGGGGHCELVCRVGGEIKGSTNYLYGRR